MPDLGQSTDARERTEPQESLLLETSSDSFDVQKLNVGSNNGQPIQLNALGPMVVNSDGVR